MEPAPGFLAHSTAALLSSKIRRVSRSDLVRGSCFSNRFSSVRKSKGVVTKHEISEVSMSHGGKPAKASSMICFIYIVDSRAGPTDITEGSNSAMALSSASHVERGYASGLEHFHTIGPFARKIM